MKGGLLGVYGFQVYRTKDRIHEGGGKSEAFFATLSCQVCNESVQTTNSRNSIRMQIIILHVVATAHLFLELQLCPILFLFHSVFVRV